jgi:dihydroorotase
MTGLQTAFAAVQTVLPGLTASRIAALFSVNARKIFNLSPATIAEEQPAEITLFNTEDESTFAKGSIKSKSYNSAFINKSLKGKAIGIYTKGSLILNK